MKLLNYIYISFLILLFVPGARAQSAASEKPTIIFVHGIWANGSCFASQIEALQAKGYPVISVQNPINSLAGDVAATQRATSAAKGKVILVGHSAKADLIFTP
jgi:pimeloyl-ACP methyl ester carboxylesterase